MNEHAPPWLENMYGYLFVLAEGGIIARLPGFVFDRSPDTPDLFSTLHLPSPFLNSHSDMPI